MKKWLAAATVMLVLAGCAHSAADYSKAAKKAIGGADAARTIGQQFQDITCQTPSSKTVGTTFTCTATGTTDGVKYEFTATITSKTQVDITNYKPAG